MTQVALADHVEPGVAVDPARLDRPGLAAAGLLELDRAVRGMAAVTAIGSADETGEHMGRRSGNFRHLRHPVRLPMLRVHVEPKLRGPVIKN